MAEYISLVEIGFTSGTRYYSYHGVSAPSNWYRDQVLSIGDISREISMTPGEYRVGDCSITLNNSDLEFSILKATDSFRGRAVTIRFGDPNGGLAAMTTVYTGKISSWNLSQGIFEITTQDTSRQRFEAKIGGLISSDVFTGIDEKTRQLIYPIIYGYCYGTSGIGTVPCRLVDTAGPFRYLVSRHVCKGLNAVYRLEKEVPTSEYTVTTSVVDGFTMTFLSFTVDQRDPADFNTGLDLEWPERDYNSNDDIHITANVAGITDDGTTGGTVIDNPVDQLKHYLKAYAGFVDGDFDTGLWTSASSKLNLLSYSGAICLVDNITHKEMIEKFCESFGLSFYITRAGLLGIGLLNLSGMTDLSSATEYSDSNEVSALTIRASDQFASRIQFNYGYNFAKNYFERQPEMIDYTEQERLGGVDKSENLNIWYSMSYWTAFQVAQRRLEMMRECQNLVEFSLPIDNFNVDLNSVIKLTHREGIGSSGYSQRGALVLGTSLNVSGRSMGLKITAMPASEPFQYLSRVGIYYNFPCAMVSSSIFVGGILEVFKSTDGGASWTSKGNLTSADLVYSFFNCGSSILLAGGAYSGTGKYWRSTNNGDTWSAGATLAGTTKILSFLKLASGRVLAFCTTSTGGQIYYSDDNGSNWTSLATYSGWTPLQAVEISAGNLVGGWLYDTDGYAHARTSGDSGSTWTDRGALGTSDECLCLIDCGSGTLLAGVQNDTASDYGSIYRSTNSGVNWSLLKQFTTLCSRIDSLLNLGSGVYLAGDGGDTDAQGFYNGGNIRYSTDYGSTWRTLQRLGLTSGVPHLFNPSGTQVLAVGSEAYGAQSTVRIYKATVIP